MGFSGIKLGLLTNIELLFIKKFKQNMELSTQEKIENFKKLEQECLEYITTNYPSNINKYIGISTPGNIINNEIIRWGGYKSNIMKQFEDLHYQVYAMNDGEAHLLSSIYKTDKDGPILGIGLGSGVSFALSINRGVIKRFQKDKNIEMGEVPLDNGNKLKIDNFCNYEKFQTSLDTNDFLQYLINLRYLITILSSLYHPKYIYIYGGITHIDYPDGYHTCTNIILPELKKIDIIKNNNITIVLGTENSGLLGSGYLALSRKENHPIYEFEKEQQQFSLLETRNNKIIELEQKLITTSNYFTNTKHMAYCITTIGFLLKLFKII